MKGVWWLIVTFSSAFGRSSHAFASYMSLNRVASQKTAGDEARKLKLFHKTPILYSTSLSSRLGKPVYLKLDAVQSSGSYKDRGMGNLCLQLRNGEERCSRLISSSGGNAGLSVATVGKKLDMAVEVIVPKTTKPVVIEKLRSLGARVTVHGENWNQADLLARQMVDESTTSPNGKAAYISPYDHPLLWTGYSSLVDELVEDLDGEVPGAIIVSVGGGGLICGVLEGLERHQLYRTAVIAAETEGAASFGYSFQNKRLVRLDEIKSIATSLGALEVTPVSLERAKGHQSKGGIVREVICTDKHAVDACWEFARDYRLLVEPACGAALATVYSKDFHDKLADIEGPIVIQVCGGSGVTLELLQQWKDEIGS
jgi:L-serine/L-threonine ammonia-lyase